MSARLNFLLGLYLTLLAAIVVRLFYWQVIRFDDLSAMAEGQHQVNVSLDAPRGLIFSSDGSVLATNKPSFLLYGLPKVVKDPNALASKLAKLIVESGGRSTAEQTEFKKLKDVLQTRLGQDLYWVPLYKDLNLSTKEEIAKLNERGLGFESGRSRYYPESSAAAHILGFVGSDRESRQTGYFGVEGFYNGELRGLSGLLTEEKDVRGAPILIGKFLKKEPRRGYNLTLNIDRTVQYIAEKKLKEGLVKYGAKSASVVIMEPKTGAILAMASFPNYDPNLFTDFPKESYKNPVVAESYEPGSTFKVLVMASAIDEEAVKPDSKCDECSGPLFLAGYVIRTWNNRYQKDINMTETIIHSDNTGMVYAARKLGLEKLYGKLREFGMGSLTQIDLQDETSPEIRPKGSWKEIDLATTSFGQGIALTPIQMIRAVGAIADGGYLMEPHVVRSIQGESGFTNIPPKVVGQPIKSSTAKVMTEMMVEAVEKGEARVFAPKGFKIAGKTGTAQIPLAGHYDPNKTVASFVGFAPADDPKFVMLVKYNEPSSSIFGAETAAPTFFDIAKELFIYYGIAPTS